RSDSEHHHCPDHLWAGAAESTAGLSVYQQSPRYRTGPCLCKLVAVSLRLQHPAYRDWRQSADQALCIGPDAFEQKFYRESLGKSTPGKIKSRQASFGVYLSFHRE